MCIPFPEDYHLEDGVWTPNAAAGDLPYNDGDEVETDLARVLAGTGDLSVLSAELRAVTRDAPARYHFSPRRANLLRPFAPLLTSQVLEVGAGCGAITRYLGEVGGSVTAVEGSRRRAAMARARTRDLPNVEVVWEDVTRLSGGPRFDVVLLVGVLEYARVFLRAGADSQRRLLAHLRGLVAEDGMLLVAIENQMGAKYWAGAAEDHLGVPFFGIQDHYGDASVATFSRHVLQEMLREAGFPHQEWYVPVPDYKMPVAVLSPAGLRLPERLDAGAILAHGVLRDERRAPQPNFSLECVWPMLQRNGLLVELANSFLVAAGPSDAFAGRLRHERRLAWSYAVDRCAAYAKESCICLEAGGLEIRRRRLAPDAAAPDSPLLWRLHDEPYPEGRNWWCELAALVARPGWTMEHLVQWARGWLEAALRQAGMTADRTVPDARRTIGGWLLDATPHHLVALRGGGYRFTDLEWKARGGVELGFLVYRALASSIGALTSMTWTRGGTPPTPAGLVAQVFTGLGFDLRDGDMERYGRLEAQVQAWALGRS